MSLLANLDKLPIKGTFGGKGGRKSRRNKNKVRGGSSTSSIGVAAFGAADMQKAMSDGVNGNSNNAIVVNPAPGLMSGGNGQMPTEVTPNPTGSPTPTGSGVASSINPIAKGGGDMKMLPLQQGGDLGTIAVPAFLVFLNNNVKGKKSRKDLKKRSRFTRRR